MVQNKKHTFCLIAVCVCECRAPRCIFIVPPGSKRLFSPIICHLVLRNRYLVVVYNLESFAGCLTSDVSLYTYASQNSDGITLKPTTGALPPFPEQNPHLGKQFGRCSQPRTTLPPALSRLSRDILRDPVSGLQLSVQHHLPS